MRVLVEYGKHGEAVYDASTPEAWAASSVAILRDRMDYYIYEPEAFEETYEYKRAFQRAGGLPTDEQMQNMPESYQASVRAGRSEIDKLRVKHDRRVKVYNDIKRIVDENDTSMVKIGRGNYERDVPLAWRYVEYRNEYEYERVDIVDVAQPHLEAPIV